MGEVDAAAVRAEEWRCFGGTEIVIVSPTETPTGVRARRTVSPSRTVTSASVPSNSLRSTLAISVRRAPLRATVPGGCILDAGGLEQIRSINLQIQSQSSIDASGAKAPRLHRGPVGFLHGLVSASFPLAARQSASSPGDPTVLNSSAQAKT